MYKDGEYTRHGEAGFDVAVSLAPLSWIEDFDEEQFQMILSRSISASVEQAHRLRDYASPGDLPVVERFIYRLAQPCNTSWKDPDLSEPMYQALRNLKLDVLGVRRANARLGMENIIYEFQV